MCVPVRSRAAGQCSTRLIDGDMPFGHYKALTVPSGVLCHMDCVLRRPRVRELCRGTRAMLFGPSVVKHSAFAMGIEQWRRHGATIGGGGEDLLK